jgi:hypothetical protein
MVATVRVENCIVSFTARTLRDLCAAVEEAERKLRSLSTEERRATDEALPEGLDEETAKLEQAKRGLVTIRTPYSSEVVFCVYLDAIKDQCEGQGSLGYKWSV